MEAKQGEQPHFLPPCLAMKMEPPPYSLAIKMQPLNSIKVLRTTKVTPSPPITSTHSPKLTFLDQFWMYLPPSQMVLFYNTYTHFPNLANKLREALSLALTHFYPLSGELVWSPESDDLEIRCGGEIEGVLFIEAEIDAGLERFVNDGIQDTDAYEELVPPLDITTLPAPVFSVQVTKFLGGGMCLGLSVHHAIGDAGAFWHFVKSWAEICRSGEFTLLPSLDRSVIRDPHGLCKFYMDHLRGSLPKVLHVHEDQTGIVRRTFLLSSRSVQLLKKRAAAQSKLGRVSTFLAVTAHAWVSSVRARQVHKDENTTLRFFTDLRSRLDPAIPEGYFGNCVEHCLLQAKGLELLRDSGFGFAVTAINRLARQVSKQPLWDRASWLSPGVDSGTVMTVAMSPKLRVYDTDFGWGRPSRVELVSRDVEGNMVFVEKRDEEDGVQVSFELAAPHMHRFGMLFLDGLDCGTSCMKRESRL